MPISDVVAPLKRTPKIQGVTLDIHFTYPPLALPSVFPSTFPQAPDQPQRFTLHARPRIDAAFVYFRVGSRAATPFPHRSNGGFLGRLVFRRDPAALPLPADFFFAASKVEGCMFPPLLSVPSCTPWSRNVAQGYLLLLVLVPATHHCPRLGPPSGPTPNKTGGRPALTSGAPRVLSPTLCLGRSPGRLLLRHSVVLRGISICHSCLYAVGAPGALEVFSRIKRKSPERFRFRHEEATTEKAPFSSTFSFSLSTLSLSSPDEAASNLPALSSETCKSLRRAQFSDIGS